MGAVIGNQNPMVGETNFYEINMFGSLPFFNPNNSYEWYLFKKQKSGSWIDITKDSVPKKGTKVDYKFFEPVAGELFEIRVFEVAKGILPSVESSKKLFGKLEITPTASKTAQIDKVILFNRGKKDVNKADYRDTLVAQAFCTALFGKEIEFQLWEDDAKGDGHDAAVNKNNRIPRVYKATVNERGIAEARISLIADEKVMRQIANKFVMKGDTDEGANHEYYVTATYLGKGEKASQVNVNVTNPDYQPKPKADSPKYPATPSSAAPAKPDEKGKVLDAYFSKSDGSKLTKVKVGEHVHVRIKTSGMVGKNLEYKVWEYDIGSNDLVSKSGKIKVVSDDIITGGFTITEKIFDKGIDLGMVDSDSEKQNYFIEVIPLDITAESKKFGVDSDGLMEVEKVKSAANVNGNKASAKDCGGKFCIKKGDKNELVREINIRLAGFGGNVPTDEFTDKTEKMVKQFQKDYMKIKETGKVCGSTLKAIDEFSKNFDISATYWGQLKCSCSTKGKQAVSKLRGIKETNNCKSFGDKTGANTSPESTNKYEFPGIHRSLLFGFKALQFYFSKQKTYKIDSFSSGYRCRFKNYKTTNHQGKAIDIQFSKGTWAIRGPQKKNLVELRAMRDDIFVKHLGAQREWPNPNLFSIEPIDLLYYKDGSLRYDHTFSWIHMDVRQYEKKYLDDKYFCTNAATLNGKSIVELAIELGFMKTCICSETYQSQKAPATSGGKCACNDKLTKEQLKAIAVHASNANIDKYLDGFNETFTKFNINSCLQKIHFLAQVIQESGSFIYNVEQGDADYLAHYKGWHGRGLIQLTTKPNYVAFEAAVGEDVTSSAAARDKVTKSPYAVHSAGWFWDKRANLNGASNENDFIYLTYRVNGGFNHIDNRLENVKKGFEILYSKCTTDKGKNTDYKFPDSKAYKDKKAAFAWGLWHDPGVSKQGCEKSKALAIEGYQRFVDLTAATDSTENYYGIQKLSIFSDLVYTKVVKNKTVKFLNVRKAALKRINELKK